MSGSSSAAADAAGAFPTAPATSRATTFAAVPLPANASPTLAAALSPSAGAVAGSVVESERIRSVKATLLAHLRVGCTVTLGRFADGSASQDYLVAKRPDLLGQQAVVTECIQVPMTRMMVRVKKTGEQLRVYIRDLDVTAFQDLPLETERLSRSLFFNGLAPGTRVLVLGSSGAASRGISENTLAEVVKPPVHPSTWVPVRLLEGPRAGEVLKLRTTQLADPAGTTRAAACNLKGNKAASRSRARRRGASSSRSNRSRPSAKKRRHSSPGPSPGDCAPGARIAPRRPQRIAQKVPRVPVPDPDDPMDPLSPRSPTSSATSPAAARAGLRRTTGSRRSLRPRPYPRRASSCSNAANERRSDGLNEDIVDVDVDSPPELLVATDLGTFVYGNFGQGGADELDLDEAPTFAAGSTASSSSQATAIPSASAYGRLPPAASHSAATHRSAYIPLGYLTQGVLPKLMRAPHAWMLRRLDLAMQLGASHGAIPTLGQRDSGLLASLLALYDTSQLRDLDTITRDALAVDYATASACIGDLGQLFSMARSCIRPSKVLMAMLDELEEYLDELLRRAGSAQSTEAALRSHAGQSPMWAMLPGQGSPQGYSPVAVGGWSQGRHDAYLQVPGLGTSDGHLQLPRVVDESSGSDHLDLDRESNADFLLDCDAEPAEHAGLEASRSAEAAAVGNNGASAGKGAIASRPPPRAPVDIDSDVNWLSSISSIMGSSAGTLSTSTGAAPVRSPWRHQRETPTSTAAQAGAPTSVLSLGDLRPMSAFPRSAAAVHAFSASTLAGGGVTSGEQKGASHSRAQAGVVRS